MRIISFIEDEEVVKKILKHLGLWLVKSKPKARANAPPAEPYIPACHRLLVTARKSYAALAMAGRDYSARPGATLLPVVGLTAS